MKIYFDESGQSGCVLTKKELLNFQKQPTFALGALVIPTDTQERALCKKYLRFLEKFERKEEIKGSDLLTRKMNVQLSYFLDNFFNDKYFFVILYDKRFYLATLLLLGLIGREYQQTIPLHFYEQAACLSYQSDDFFVKYLQYIESPSPDAYKQYLAYLIDYDYRLFNVEENAVVEMAKKILEDEPELFYNDFMSFGWYENPEQTNVINLNALAELIYTVKSTLNVRNEEIYYIHDNMKEFEETFKSELQDYGIQISFADSKSEVPLQIIDNVVSITRHAYDKMIGHIKEKDQWKDNAAWDMKLFSKVIRKLSVSHVNFTVPISDWSAALCMTDMFAPQYPKNLRNNFVFNSHYIENTQHIYSSLLEAYKSDIEVTGILKD